MAIIRSYKYAPETETISQFTDMCKMTNHRKKWTEEDNTVLNQIVNNNEVITYLLVSETSKILKRTPYAIKIRMMKNYIIPNYDYVDYNNDELYNKYACFSKESIDNMVYLDYNKKERILVKLDKMSRMIDVDHVNCQDELLKMIDDITELL